MNKEELAAEIARQDKLLFERGRLLDEAENKVRMLSKAASLASFIAQDDLSEAILMIAELTVTLFDAKK